MWQLRKSFTFEASHLLPHHDGKCRQLHGHSWSLTVCVGGTVLTASGPKSGMLADFGDLSRVAKPLVERLDHSHLNDILPNPTSELVAEYAFGQVARLLPDGCRLLWVEIGETCTTACRYSAI